MHFVKIINLKKIVQGFLKDSSDNLGLGYYYRYYLEPFLEREKLIRVISMGLNVRTISKSFMCFINQERHKFFVYKK